MSQIKYRPDIDGLRALAVGSVITFHAFPEFVRGGFVGVDIFFVISGYLISSILFTDLERSSFSFIDFYSRRIKRIFPALLFVLLSCLAFGSVVLLADEYRQFGKHAAAGAGFVSNITLWNEIGYFDNASDTKPLLHLWSLGVEEQFYIAWPLLLFLIWQKRMHFLMLVAILALASFSLSVFSLDGHADAAFYSPLCRFWELMTGSLLAYWHLHPPRRLQNQSSYSNILSIVNSARPAWPSWQNHSAILGLLLILIAIFWLNKHTPFPGWLALLPTSGAFLILAAGGDAWVNRVLLTNRVMVWIGLISYPLYLWHWPLLSFARIIGGEMPSETTRALLMTLGVFLASMTYWLIEKPIRFHTHGSKVIVTLIISMGCVGFVGYKINQGDGIKYRLGNLQQSEDPFASPKTILKKQRTDCRNHFPNAKGICFSNFNAGPAAGKSVVFIGDSHSEALSTGFMISFPEIRVNSFGAFGCLPFIGVERFDNRLPQGCNTSLMQHLSYISSQESEVVVLTARYAWYITGKGFDDKNPNLEPDLIHIQSVQQKNYLNHSDYQKTFAEGLTETLRFFSAHHKRVIFVHQVPELNFDPKICIDRPLRKNSSKSCLIPRIDVEQRQKIYREIANRILAEFPNTQTLDPMDLLCDKHYCYAQKNGTTLYRDDDHLSIAGASQLSAKLKELIQSQ